MESYRSRRRRLATDTEQSSLPFSEDVPPLIAVQEPCGEQIPSPPDDFSFSIAIGRCGGGDERDDAQFFIDVTEPANLGTAIGPATHAALDRGQSALYPVASVEERRIVGLIDAACLFFAYGGFLALFGSLGGQFTFSKLSAAVYAIAFAIVYLQYFSLFTVFGGTTPGMMLRGIRVVDFSGEQPSPRQLLLRAAGYLLSGGTFFLGFLWAMWDEDSLTWHDRLSHTYQSPAETLTENELSEPSPLR